MRVAVTGGSGTIGRALAALRPDWTYLSKSDCDIRSVYNVYQRLAALAPDVVLHTAALTDHAHPNAAEVIETNIVGTQHVGEAGNALNIPVVYLSTHYVYPGERGNYSETDTVRPIGTYAWSKLAAEHTIGIKLIVRGSWYTRKTRLDRWAARGALADAWCSREPATDSAKKIVALVESGAHGIVNIGGARRSFAQILEAEGYEDFDCITRDQFYYDTHPRDAAQLIRPVYPFPADTSVNTERFDALELAWRDI